MDEKQDYEERDTKKAIRRDTSLGALLERSLSVVNPSLDREDSSTYPESH